MPKVSVGRSKRIFFDRLSVGREIAVAKYSEGRSLSRRWVLSSSGQFAIVSDEIYDVSVGWEFDQFLLQAPEEVVGRRRFRFRLLLCHLCHLAQVERVLLTVKSE